MKRIKSISLISLLVGGGLILSAQTENKKSNHDFDISKNFEIYYSLFRELDLFYVDSVAPQKLIEKSMNSMLQELDPYTNYISESEMKDFMFITTGEYGGVGSMIGTRKGIVFFSEPYEGKPAQKAGIKAGDVILEIDGVEVKGKSTADVSEKLKGQAGTVVHLKVQRPGVEAPMSFEIRREKISLNAVNYSDLVVPNVGYIQITSFTDKTSDEFKEAFLALKSKGAQGLVIDLRDNGGGIMEEAINIVNFFVPKGNEVVSTRGKVKQWDRTYLTTREPIDTEIPIVVLVNHGSASASEILSGALQDLDRAVVMGSQTYGKGLVQTTRSLPYNGSLKVTTAKYYIPSGRCVQAIDYSNRNPDGSVGKLPDSLTTEFRTRNGRIVRDGGGIKPDVVIEEKEATTILFYLMMENVIFDFATDFVQRTPAIAVPKEFRLSEDEYQRFEAFVKSKEFQYDKQSVKMLDKLKEMAKFEGYYSDALPEFEALEKKLSHDVSKSLKIFKSDISKQIEQEIVRRYYFQNGAMASLLRDDEILVKATDLLNKRDEYNTLLGVKELKKSVSANIKRSKKK